MAIRLVAITPVFNAGLIVPIGEMFSTDDNYAKLLIKAGSAEVYVEPKNLAENQGNSQTLGNDTQNTEELTKVFMALKLDELKQLATKNKVELSAEDTTKAAITSKLIAAGVVTDE